MNECQMNGLQLNESGPKTRRLYPFAAWLIGLFLLCTIIAYAVVGTGARIAVPDNLDLFQAQYKMLKNTGTFFTQGAKAPFLHGVTRDDLPSEFSLTGLLYLVLPPFAAYVAVYVCKVLISVGSFYLLADELQKRQLIGALNGEKQADGQQLHVQLVLERQTQGFCNLALLGGFSYGILNLFPSFGISFASIPLIIWLLLKIEAVEDRKKLLLLYLGVFLYPFVSYFSYFGLFILCYMCATFIWVSAARRKPDWKLFAAIVVLSLGFMTFEYRLFRAMLFTDEVTIRSTMVIADMTPAQILEQIKDVFLTGGAIHTKSVQGKLVLPVCVIYFVILNVGYILKKNVKGIFHDLFNLGALILVFNSFVYGIYYFAPFRNLVESLIPPLKGWQFGRTSFFSPFLWYGLFFIALVRLYNLADSKNGIAAGHGTQLVKAAAYMLSMAASFVILLSPTTYNDLYNTAHAEANRILRGVEEDSLTYQEFYSEALFEEAMEEIGYDGEWAAAYGFHPAVLEYNGINTIDGYLGFYPQEYKEAFRKVIAPALDKQELTRQYFDNWGARCYLYSGTNLTVVEAVRNYPHAEDTADIDLEALKELECKYIFSRTQLIGLEDMLTGIYQDEESPYILYVYRIK